VAFNIITAFIDFFVGLSTCSVMPGILGAQAMRLIQNHTKPTEQNYLHFRIERAKVFSHGCKHFATVHVGRSLQNVACLRMTHRFESQGVQQLQKTAIQSTQNVALQISC
jgi:hypothetical protein